MNIQLFSDLHLEFAGFVPQLAQADVAVFAGDIKIGSKGIKWLHSLACEKPMLYVSLWLHGICTTARTIIWGIAASCVIQGVTRVSLTQRSELKN